MRHRAPDAGPRRGDSSGDRAAGPLWQPDGAVLGAAALVYLLPLGLLLAVCLAAQSLGGVWMAVLGAAAFAVGLIPALLWNRHLRRRPMEYRITGRVD